MHQNTLGSLLNNGADKSRKWWCIDDGISELLPLVNRVGTEDPSELVTGWKKLLEMLAEGKILFQNFS